MYDQGSNGIEFINVKIYVYKIKQNNYNSNHNKVTIFTINLECILELELLT